MNFQSKHFQPDQDAPETSRQERCVEEGSRREPEQDGSERVKGKEDESIADQIAGDGGVPCGIAKGVSVKDGRLRTVDEHGPEAKLADDFEQRTPTDKHLFDDVGEAVECCCCDGEEVALQLVGSVAANVIALDVI